MSDKPVQEWTIDEVCQFLVEIGLSSISDQFKLNAVSGSDLLTLTDDDYINSLHCTPLQMKKIKNSIQEKQNQSDEIIEPSAPSLLPDPEPVATQPDTSVSQPTVPTPPSSTSTPPTTTFQQQQQQNTNESFGIPPPLDYQPQPQIPPMPAYPQQQPPPGYAGMPPPPPGYAGMPPQQLPPPYGMPMPPPPQQQGAPPQYFPPPQFGNGQQPYGNPQYNQQYGGRPQNQDCCIQ